MKYSGIVLVRTEAMTVQKNHREIRHISILERVENLITSLYCSVWNNCTSSVTLNNKNWVYKFKII